jgi:hypothetical protein
VGFFSGRIIMSLNQSIRRIRGFSDFPENGLGAEGIWGALEKSVPDKISGGKSTKSGHRVVSFRIFNCPASLITRISFSELSA